MIYNISTHDLARRSTDLENRSRAQLAFQLTTSQGGRRNHAFFLLRCCIFQLTTSQGGRHLDWLLKTTTDISTHDLARRLTGQTFARKYTIYISTHDLARRSTSRTRLLYALWARISAHDLARRSTCNSASVWF